MGVYYIKRTDDYLEHHGIKGQRWGIRRYQNEDGTRTDAGLRRERAARGTEYSQESKNAFSAKATANKALAKIYKINEKAYAKSNKTLSSANAAAKEKFLKKSPRCSE